MRPQAFTTLALSFTFTALVATACYNSADDCEKTGTCTTGGTSNDGGSGTQGGSSAEGGASGESGTSGIGGLGGGGGDGAGCRGDVSEDPECWTNEELGVFVSSDAEEDGDGTRTAPYRTIGAGIAAANGKNVYVCLGAADAYEEQIVIDDNVDGVKVYAGFDCADWSYDVTRTVQVRSPENVGIRIEDLKIGTTLENLRIYASDAKNPGESSYGGRILDSDNVVLRRVRIEAGDGADGDDGDPGEKGADGAEAGAEQKGAAAVCDGELTDATPGGRWSSASACGSIGGEGGDGDNTVFDGANGKAGEPIANVTPANVNNRGEGEPQVPGDWDPESINGSNGSPGDSGENGMRAAEQGAFDSLRYKAAGGGDGLPGFPGQGGGGGGASKGSATCYGASGGAGGMGGCGGTPGTGGQGGGASIGLLVWESTLSLEATEMVANSGGRGGDGGPGGERGQGSGGALGGNGASVIGRGGIGGAGGTGGEGGSGSGGTGGPSIAIVYRGGKPNVDNEELLRPGDGGEAGIGGQVNEATEKAPDGYEGQSLKWFEVP